MARNSLFGRFIKTLIDSFSKSFDIPHSEETKSVDDHEHHIARIFSEQWRSSLEMSNNNAEKRSEQSSFSDEFLFQLPLEIISYIISLLNLRDIGRLSSSCSTMYMLIQSDSSIWKCLAQRLNLLHSLQTGLGTPNSNSICWMCYLKFVNNLQWEKGHEKIEIKENKTALNIEGGWHSIPLALSIHFNSNDTHGEVLNTKGFSYSGPVCRFSFRIDKWACNGIMLAIVTDNWLNLERKYLAYPSYPGTGFGGVSSTWNGTMFETIAFYSHDKEVFCTDDTIDLVVSFQTKEVSFFKNGEHKVSHQLPGFPIHKSLVEQKYLPLRIIASLCGKGQIVSIVKPSSILFIQQKPQ